MKNFWFLPAWLFLVMAPPVMGADSTPSALSPYITGEAPPSGRDLVDGSLRRAYYAGRMLGELCQAPRPSGSEAYMRGAALLRDEFARSLPIARLDEVHFKNWRPLAPASLTIDGRPVQTIVHHFSPSVPEGSLSGRIIKTDEEAFAPYAIRDERTGEIAAWIRVGPFGPPHTAFNRTPENARRPIFSIGSGDVALLEQAVELGLPVQAAAPAEMVQAVSHNVVATLPGRTSREILVIAHADTVYTSPGANDNTASVVIMLMLAHALAESRPEHTITFLATTNEECGYLGAFDYAERRRAAGTFDQIRFCLNFDSLTYGENLLLTTEHDRLRDLLQEAHRAQGLASQVRVSRGAPRLDATPFVEAGIPAIYFNSRGTPDSHNLSYVHRPEETVDKVDPRALEEHFLVLKAFLQALDREPA